MDFKNPEKEPKPMFPTVANALGVPADTFMMPWPKKPLGKAPGAKTGANKGTSKGTAKGHPKGHSPGRTMKHRKPSYEAGFG